MLPQREIVAWRTHAPWATDVQVEQDLLITRAMIAIFRDPFLSTQVAMRGGTMLHKIHVVAAARYSEDIDLVAVGKRPGNHIRLALIRVLSPVLGGEPRTDVMAQVKLAIRNTIRPSRLLVLEWVYVPTSDPRLHMKLKIEVNVTERAAFYPLMRIPFAPPLPEGPQEAEVVTYDVNEMLGTKMRALYQRDHGRDLFDLDYALTHGHTDEGAHQVEPRSVVAAFQHYLAQEGTMVSRDDFERALRRKVGLARFRADLTDVLASGVGYDVDAAEERVRENLLSRLP
jgi:predicted nucleotidyltransferase component of viral defense system